MTNDPDGQGRGRRGTKGTRRSAPQHNPVKSNPFVKAARARRVPEVPDIAEETAVLLDETSTFLRRFVTFRGEDDADLLALYVAVTWAVDAFHSCGYVYVTAAEKGCGKSRCLEVLAEMMKASQMASLLSASSLYRLLDAGPRTLLIDEADAIYKRGKPGEEQERLRAVLNGGYRRGNPVVLSVPSKSKGWEAREIDVFGPKVMAGIDNGCLPDTIVDRSFVVRLTRARSKPERFIPKRLAEETTELRGRWEEWAARAVPQLEDAEPEGLDALEDRAYEIAEPLAAVADLAGKGWSSKGKAAVIDNLKSSQDRSSSTGSKLLGAIRHVFRDRSVTRLHTVDLLKALHDRDGEPWGGWMAYSRPVPGLTERDLADLLYPYEVRPLKVKIDGRSLQGYKAESFEAAWQSFCPVPFGSSSVHRPQDPEPPEPPAPLTAVEDPEPPEPAAPETAAAVAPFMRGNGHSHAD